MKENEHKGMRPRPGLVEAMKPERESGTYLEITLWVDGRDIGESRFVPVSDKYLASLILKEAELSLFRGGNIERD